jgi:hypothetical protein
MFYKDYPSARLEVSWPEINSDDIVMMGSYFVLNPVLRPKVKDFLDYAREHGALIYYDFNFRSSHKHEAIKIYADMLENLEYTDIVRGSVEDLENLFGNGDAAKVYKREIEFYCKNFLCTDAGGDIKLITPSVSMDFKVDKIPTVSTIGAGDNFNAGVVYGLIKYGVRRNDLANLDEGTWTKIIQCGKDLAADVCQSFNNSISKEFAEAYKFIMEELQDMPIAPDEDGRPAVPAPYENPTDDIPEGDIVNALLDSDDEDVDDDETQRMFPCCSSCQSQKGMMTWGNSRPLDLWIEMIRMPCISSLCMVLAEIVSSHSFRKRAISEGFCKEPIGRA